MKSALRLNFYQKTELLCWVRIGQFSAVPSALKVNLTDNANESVPRKGLIQWEMLIKTLAYEKMNDLKDAPDKSSQKWLC